MSELTYANITSLFVNNIVLPSSLIHFECTLIQSYCICNLVKVHTRWNSISAEKQLSFSFFKTQHLLLGHHS